MADKSRFFPAPAEPPPDVELFRAWEQRLDAHLRNDAASKHSPLIFAPCPHTEQALIRLSVTAPGLVRELRDAVANCWRLHATLNLDEGYGLSEAMFLLLYKLRSAVPLIETNQGGITRAALSDNEYTVLRALRDARPRRVLLTTLEANTGMTRRTCATLLAGLAARGLADYDANNRVGAAITPEGEKLLASEGAP